MKKAKIDSQKKHIQHIYSCGIPEEDTNILTGLPSFPAKRNDEIKIPERKKIPVYLISLIVHILVVMGISFYSWYQKNLLENNKIPDNIEVQDIEQYIPAPQEEIKSDKSDNMKIEEDAMTTNTKDNDQNVIKANPEGSDTGKTIGTGDSDNTGGNIDYVPQFKLSEVPIAPDKEIRSKIVYPPLAQKQELEGLVILKLYIDKNGNVRNIAVLKDPGFGFAEAAIKAISMAKFILAKDSNGNPCACEYKYPVRFTLK